MLRFGLLVGHISIVKVSLWALGNCDGISHYFHCFYKPNNQSINRENNHQINPE